MDRIQFNNFGDTGYVVYEDDGTITCYHDSLETFKRVAKEIKARSGIDMINPNNGSIINHREINNYTEVRGDQ